MLASFVEIMPKKSIFNQTSQDLERGLDATVLVERSDKVGFRNMSPVALLLSLASDGSMTINAPIPPGEAVEPMLSF